MNRRALLKSGILTTSGLLLGPGLTSFKGIHNGSNNKIAEPSVTLKLLIGQLETYIFYDGVISLPAIQPIFAPETDLSALNEELQKLHSPLNKLETGINVMLIRKDEKVILIDAGSGHHFGADGGKLTAALKTIGLGREDITDIVFTHAHVDHMGGLLTANDELIFPRASYHLAKKEYEFWMSGRPDFSHSKGDESSARFNIAFAKSTLSRIRHRTALFDYGQELFSCLLPEPGEGHTPGHTLFTISSQGKSLMHIADTFHTPFLVTRPDWGSQWDTDFDMAIQTRKRIIKASAAKGTLLMSCHLPWPGLGYIDKIGADYYWNSYRYTNPAEIVI